MEISKRPVAVLRSPDIERKEFSLRLIEAIRHCGYKPSPTQLFREFNLRSPQSEISVHAARKWLLSEAMPTQPKLKVLAEWLRVTSEWLRFGPENTEEGKLPVFSGPVPTASQVAVEVGRLKEVDQMLVLDFVRLITKRSTLVEINIQPPKSDDGRIPSSHRVVHLSASEIDIFRP